MVPPDFFKIYWICWIVIGFGVVEFIAVRYQIPNAAFSNFIWWITDTGSDGVRDWYRWVARGLMVLFFIWIIPHFFTKWNV